MTEKTPAASSLNGQYLIFVTTIMVIAIIALAWLAAEGSVAAGIALGAMVMLLVVVIVWGLSLAQQLLSQRHEERSFQANQTENVKMLEQSEKAMNQQLLGMTRMSRVHMPNSQEADGGLDYDEAVFEMLEAGEE